MQKLARHHYLKHYLGGPALVEGEKIVTGQIEQVEIEDGSILIKSGTESHWHDAANVSPSLKQFKNITQEDIRCIVDHIVIDNERISKSEIEFISCVHGNEWVSGACSDQGAFVRLTFNRVLWIKSNWSIIAEHGKTPDNIGTIIFLLCEMGYDVTGKF